MRGGIGLICAASVLAMGTGNVLQFSQNSQIKENFHNTAEFEDFAQQVAAVVPANTHAFGLNVAEVYSMLHWSTQCFTMDFSDMAVRPDSLKELKEQLKQRMHRQFLQINLHWESGREMIWRHTSGSAILIN